MYDINDRQYIIRQSNGKVSRIFYKPNSGLFLSRLDKKGIWTEPSLITKDVLPGYSICTDKSDRIYILCQDRQGNIKYTCCENEKWSSKTILRSRSFSPYDKHLCISSDGKALHFFYTLRYSEKNLLSYQMMKISGEMTDPKVIDYVSEAANPYFLMQAPGGNLYLFYTYQDNKYSRVGFKKLTHDKNSWSDFFPITEFNGESNVLYCTPAVNNTIFVCWQRHATNSYELVLSIRNQDSGEWDNEMVINTSSEPYTGSSMYISENRSVIYWIRNNNIICSISDDSGSTWSDPSAYPLPNDNQLHCIAYLSNSQDDEIRQASCILPGTVSHGYKLAFVESKASEEKKNEPVKAGLEDIQLPLLKSLKDLSDQLESVRKLLGEIDAKLDSMEAKQSQLEVEIGRYSSKLTITDTDLIKIRSLLADIKKSFDNNIIKTEKNHDLITEIHEEKNIDMPLISNTPIMPGAGFASITPEFLRSLQKK